MTVSSQQNNDPTAKLPTQILSPELLHLQVKYEFTTMSIISSSKIEQKVRSLLQHLEKFHSADTNAKPGVVALHAKSSVASKLVSIVEIAKKNVAKEGGKWWQYSRLHGQKMDLKEKLHKSKDREKIFLKRQQHGQDTESADVGDQREPSVKEDGNGQEEEDENAFQTMGESNVSQQSVNGVANEGRKKIRAIPIMTVYMSRVPIAEFKGIYG